jgi:hypothetical protein
LQQIILYDIIGQRWYTQNATGDIPANRRRFCAGATWAQDQSSYNIYLYGGNSVPAEGGPGFDDVYILTLPSFTWIKWYIHSMHRFGTITERFPGGHLLLQAQLIRTTH